MKTEHSGAKPVEDNTNTKTATSFPMDKAKRQMKTVPFQKPNSKAKFPTNTILVEKQRASGTTRFFVYDGRTLVETRSYPSTTNRTAHYEILNELRDEYPGFDVQSGTWNPVRKRTDGENNLTFNLPIKLVEET